MCTSYFYFQHFTSRFVGWGGDLTFSFLLPCLLLVFLSWGTLEYQGHVSVPQLFDNAQSLWAWMTSTPSVSHVFMELPSTSLVNLCARFGWGTPHTYTPALYTVGHFL